MKLSYRAVLEEKWPTCQSYKAKKEGYKMPHTAMQGTLTALLLRTEVF
jgi:hypothetical protein